MALPYAQRLHSMPSSLLTRQPRCGIFQNVARKNGEGGIYGSDVGHAPARYTSPPVCVA